MCRSLRVWLIEAFANALRPEAMATWIYQGATPFVIFQLVEMALPGIVGTWVASSSWRNPPNVVILNLIQDLNGPPEPESDPGLEFGLTDFWVSDRSQISRLHR